MTISRAFSSIVLLVVKSFASWEKLLWPSVLSSKYLLCTSLWQHHLAILTPNRLAKVSQVIRLSCHFLRTSFLTSKRCANCRYFGLSPSDAPALNKYKFRCQLLFFTELLLVQEPEVYHA